MATATIERVQTNGNGKSNGRHGSNGHGTNGHNRISGSGSNGHGKGNAGGKQKPSPLSAAEVELRIQSWEKKRADAKALYGEADVIERELIEALGVNAAIQIGGGRTVKINDNFVDKAGNPRNVSYKPCGVKRFEIEVK